MSARLMFHIACWSCMTGLLAPQAASADLFADLEVHGFLTQGFVKTSANRFFGDSEDGSFDFTEVGVNASVQPSQNVRLSGQLLSRRAGEMADGSPKIDFAVVDVALFSSTDGQVNILGGRVKNPLGLFNDTRDVSFTRPGVFLPQSIYYQGVRSLALSADGLAIRLNWFSTFGNLDLQAGVGRPIVDANIEYAYLGQDLSGDYQAQGLSWVSRLLFETPDEAWRLAFSAAATTLDYQNGPSSNDISGETDILYTIISAQHLSANWTLSAEYVSHPIDYSGFSGTPFSGISRTMEGYYVQLNWYATQDLEMLLRLEKGFIDRSDRDGGEFHRETGLPAHTRYTRAFALGFRWKPTFNFMFEAEFQRNDGTFFLSNRENQNPFERKRTWDLFTLSASYRF